MTDSLSPRLSKTTYFSQNLHRASVKASARNLCPTLSPHFLCSRFSAVRISQKTSTALEREHNFVSKTYVLTFKKWCKVCKTIFVFKSDALASMRCTFLTIDVLLRFDALASARCACQKNEHRALARARFSCVGTDFWCCDPRKVL